nr:hypothetical protein [Pseudoroseomonas deserti]
MSSSGLFQPPTTFSAKRPSAMMSMVADCFAAVTGCSAGACDVAITVIRFVAWAMPAHQVKGSSVTPLGWRGWPGM